MSSPAKTAVIAIAAFTLGGFAGRHLGGGSDRLVARVNGEEIRESHLQGELTKRFASAVLRDVVSQKLIQQEAAKEKVELPAGALEARLEELKKQPEVDAMIKAGNLSEDDLRRNLSTLLPLDALTEKQIKEEDEKEFLLRHREELETLELQDLVFPDERSARKAFEELQEPGADFDKVANDKAPVTEVHRAQLEPLWAEILFRLDKGTISPVLKNRAGFHIFKVGDHKFEYKDLKPKIREQLIAEKRGEVLEELRHKAKIEVLAPYKLPAESENSTASPTPAPAATSTPAASRTATPAATATPRGVPSGVPLDGD